jgi:hypothetical protein
MVCILPVREIGSSSWLGTGDAFGADLWGIEPMCQVAGICNDKAVILNSCHAVPIGWSNVPCIKFKSRKSKLQRLMLEILVSTRFWNRMFFALILCMAFLEKAMPIMGRPPGPEPFPFQGFRWAAFLTLFPSLLFGFLAPFCCSFVFGSEV